MLSDQFNLEVNLKTSNLKKTVEVNGHDFLNGTRVIDATETVTMVQR